MGSVPAQQQLQPYYFGIQINVGTDPEESTHFLKWGIYTNGRVLRRMALPEAVSLGSSIRPASLRLLTRAARFTPCCN